MISKPVLFALSAGFPTVTLFIVALVLVVGGLFVWAAFIREPGQHHSRHRRHHWRQPKPEKLEKAEPGDAPDRQGGVFSKKRRKRRKGRPANPTLAETGGLPPKRSDRGESK